jgi:hypothetical protein
MSGAKLDWGVEMMATQAAKSERPVSVMFDDLDLIADVLPDYVLGRRRGLTDEETERRARAALTWAINRISEQGEKLNHFTDSVRERGAR